MILGVNIGAILDKHFYDFRVMVLGCIMEKSSANNVLPAKIAGSPNYSFQFLNIAVKNRLENPVWIA